MYSKKSKKRWQRPGNDTTTPDQDTTKESNKKKQ